MSFAASSRTALWALLAALVVATPLPVYAQGSPTGTLTGVADSSGGVFPGVTSPRGTLRPASRSTPSAVAGATGDFRAAGGHLRSMFDLNGFKKVVEAG